jgi:hypothetical protein
VAGELLMWLSDLHAETLTVWHTHTGPADTNGVPVEAREPYTWDGCHVGPGAGTEDTTRGRRVTQTLEVSGPLAEWLASGDRVDYQGNAWRVDGPPRHFRTVNPHTEATLVAWKGM